MGDELCRSQCARSESAFISAHKSMAESEEKAGATEDTKISQRNEDEIRITTLGQYGTERRGILNRPTPDQKERDQQEQEQKEPMAEDENNKERQRKHESRIEQEHQKHKSTKPVQKNHAEHMRQENTTTRKPTTQGTKIHIK